MFDESLHRQDSQEKKEEDMTDDTTPAMIPHPKVCSYCGTRFASRNQLFYHLGFHNIDIRQWWEKTPDAREEYEEYIQNKNKHKRKKCFKTWSYRCRHKALKKKNTNTDVLVDMIKGMAV